MALQLGDEITFEAVHFGIRQRLTSKITEMEPPLHFVDQMQKGAFRSFRHQHHFETRNGATAMKDIFGFEAQFGILGSIAERLFLRCFMCRFLDKRNTHLKSVCEASVKSGKS